MDLDGSIHPGVSSDRSYENFQGKVSQFSGEIFELKVVKTSECKVLSISAPKCCFFIGDPNLLFVISRDVYHGYVYRIQFLWCSYLLSHDMHPCFETKDLIQMYFAKYLELGGQIFVFRKDVAGSGSLL